ncbi:hypothetical protein [Lactobacillus sp. wkB10]|uniref:hypothetical protein n=1 Tax=Lactobacillus sp. wkB10 TaxID=1545701 RepID=UPI000512C230|nr:hypothetical protein [Lactobacillus sp. wkB10]KGG53978.1 hypothetical protein LACWKB10_1198 [Lactobacillus sp. wkB10]
MRDLKVDDHGDLVIDPVTHDLEIVDGIDEIAQRIKATLSIHLGEMANLDPDQGTNYTNFFVKNFKKNIAQTDIADAIERNIPEVNELTDVTFEKQPERGLKVEFKANVTLEDGTNDTAEGGLNIGD